VNRAVVTERALKWSRRAGLLLAAVIGVALLASACGSPSSSSGSGPSSSAEVAAALSFSKCMRAHGVKDYPDPTQTGGNHITKSFSGDPNSPQFLAAQNACQKLLPGGGSSQPVSPALQRAWLKWAACIRSHGVPSFADPTFTSSGVQIQSSTSEQAQFQLAEQACMSLMPT
jgi:hypothetical protein